MQRSTVKWFDAKKGYGFIQHPDEGDDVFVHYSQILSEKDFKTLRTGQPVRFELNDGPKGLHALDVRPLDEDGEKEPTKKADDDGSVPSEDPAAEESDAAESTAAAEPAAASTAAPASADSATEQSEAATEQNEPEEEEEDEWRSDWDEDEWTDEHGNPPDPMAGPTF
jgi:CspA family cold shock protein